MSMTGSDQEPVALLDAFFRCVRDCPGVPAVETVDGPHSYEEIASLASQLAATCWPRASIGCLKTEASRRLPEAATDSAGANSSPERERWQAHA